MHAFTLPSDPRKADGSRKAEKEVKMIAPVHWLGGREYSKKDEHFLTVSFVCLSSPRSEMMYYIELLGL